MRVFIHHFLTLHYGGFCEEVARRTSKSVLVNRACSLKFECVEGFVVEHRKTPCLEKLQEHQDVVVVWKQFRHGAGGRCDPRKQGVAQVDPGTRRLAQWITSFLLFAPSILTSSCFLQDAEAFEGMEGMEHATWQRFSFVAFGLRALS